MSTIQVSNLKVGDELVFFGNTYKILYCGLDYFVILNLEELRGIANPEIISKSDLAKELSDFDCELLSSDNHRDRFKELVIDVDRNLLKLW